jgi:hypothetical protein
MTPQVSHSPRPWQRKAWVQVLAILLGVAPIYAMSIMSHLYQGPAEIVDSAINGLVLAVYYLIFGRGSAVASLEHDACTRQPVKIGRLHVGKPQRTDRVVALLVRYD